MIKDKKYSFFSWSGLHCKNNNVNIDLQVKRKTDISSIESKIVTPVAVTEIYDKEARDIKPTLLQMQMYRSETNYLALSSAVQSHGATTEKISLLSVNTDLIANKGILAADKSISPLVARGHKEQYIGEETVSLRKIQLRKEGNVLSTKTTGIEPSEIDAVVTFDDSSVDSVAKKCQDSSTELISTVEVANKEDISPLLISDCESLVYERVGFFTRLKNSLVKTRQNLGSVFIRLFHGKKIDDDLFEKLEEKLLLADVGIETTHKIINNLINHTNHHHLKDAEALYGQLRAEMAAILINVEQPLEITGKAPFVILMVGVNGVGKTTTIGKLAHFYQTEGKSVMLASGDTFRAAAMEQLQVWGKRNNIPVISQRTGADSASVIFDAIQAAKARCIDVLIADTAGRLQSKMHLMGELKKIVRVIKKLDIKAPHEVMLILDASTGQNGINQVNLFNDTVGLTGITLTKLDGTAKGGVVFAVADRFGIPIRFIGVGEGIEDLRPFKSYDFIKALFA